MTAIAENRAARRARERTLTRGAILEAARRVASRSGSREISLRAVAAEAGYAPAALYGYFQNKDDLLLALAAEELSAITRAMREAGGDLAAAASAALGHLQTAESIAAAMSALPVVSNEAERHFNGKLIGALTALAEASGKRATTRDTQADVVLLAATLAGLAMLLRSGRLQALGFNSDDMLAALDRHFVSRP